MDNGFLDILDGHKSERAFSDKPVTEAVVDRVLKAAWLGPTSVNSQQVSVVVVRDPQVRARMAEIAGGQPWIAEAPVFLVVLVDFHKCSLALGRRGIEEVVHGSVEGLVTGVQDAGIALGRLMAAAQSCGLGIVPIGAIRRDPVAVAELLGLPKLTFPVNGLCLGHVAQPAVQKPRLDFSTFRHSERYREEGLPEAIDAYDRQLLAHWQSLGRTDGQSWTDGVAEHYRQVYFPGLKAALEAQGFRPDR